MSAIRRSSGAKRSSGELKDGAWTPIVAACAALLTRGRPFAGKKARGEASDRGGRTRCGVLRVRSRTWPAEGGRRTADGGRRTAGRELLPPSAIPPSAVPTPIV